MNFWSEGLGDRELVMALDRAKIEQRGDIVVLSGVVDSPAPWEYEVKMQREDWTAILRTATRPETGAYIVTAAPLGVMLAMVGSVVRFIVGLAWRRMARVFTGHGPAEPTPAGTSLKEKA